MCWAMATGLQNQEGVPENQLKRKLAAAVRSIQWSYAIFWSISARQPGVLEWGDGYYNGDIKTRKTVQHMELNADEMGLQRSEQLRMLYESLSAGDNNSQSKRPAALSPEDLTDAEWYYLVCMSFIFNPGQGLPGRALANGHHIWLYNAPYADSKVFTRSLLAKSASIQTVVCFPFMGGVLELGVTELVSEDTSLLQIAKTAFLEFPKLICSEQSTPIPQKADNDEDKTCTELDHNMGNDVPLEILNPVANCEMLPEGGGNVPSGSQAFPISHPSYAPKEEIEHDQERIDELNTGSSDDSSNGCCANHHTDDSFMVDGLNGTTSQVQSWQFMDDEFSNGIHASVNSSDRISRCHVVNPEKAVSPPKGGDANNILLRDLHECKHTKFGLLDFEMDYSHYTKTLSAIFRNSHRLVVKPYFHNGSGGSSFMVWRKDSDAPKPSISGSQKMLKKILFDVAWMHSLCSQASHEEINHKGQFWKLDGDISLPHLILERRQREKLNEKFLILRSLVPSICRFDKTSILGDTIEYIKELERRVEDLEGCKESAESEARERRKHPDVVERTSDNYGNNDTANVKRPSMNKRKACDIDEGDIELNWVLSKDSLADMTVTIMEKEVVIEMRCPWRECLLLEIVDAISGLHLDALTVQSSTADGILSVTLKSKFRGAAVTSAGMIKQTLQRVVSKC